MGNWTPEKMRALRKHLKHSQEEFVEALGLKRRASVSDMERGEMEISERTVVILDLLASHSGFEYATPP